MAYSHDDAAEIPDLIAQRAGYTPSLYADNAALLKARDSRVMGHHCI